MRGQPIFRLQASCQPADLAAAAPTLTELDLRGNLLWRQPLESLVGCFGSWPALKTLRLGLKEVYEKNPATPASTAEKVEAIRACLPKDCVLE
ncbi:hypothetical protein TrLO_g3422 [Triparma laevis f. longispina]|uniref:Uncharacterized protein n=1 Tax=Triparma laevis f. longispina TaxID=1714387 RepID=A0A9W7F8B0_9STRA|nr:hypothetical protein TrLO_g3422 [Triparma laevis f. longispina]